MSAKKPPNHCECSKEISRRATRCRTCANQRSAADPVAVARRSASLRRVMSSPEVRAKVSKAVSRVAAVRADDPTWIDGKRRAGRMAFAAGNLEAGRSPAARAKAGKAISAAHLSHIPEVYRDYYRSLKSRGLNAAEREQLVRIREAEDHARERRLGLSPEDAARYLQRSRPVFRCNDAGVLDALGGKWRIGSLILPASEVIDYALDRGWDPHAWRKVA